MSDYTPTTGEVRRRYAYARADQPPHKNQRAVAEFDRWLAAHDAEVRAAALAEQGETEWEYGNEMLMNNHTQIYPASSEFMAKAQAWLWPMYCRRKAGQWMPVEQGTDREVGGPDPKETP